MKIGAFLIILLLALVFLGFLINDSLHTHSELAEANNAIVSQRAELAQIQVRMAEQTSEMQGLIDQNNSLQILNKDLGDRNRALESKAQSLSDEVNRLRTENERLPQIAMQSKSETSLSLKQAMAEPIFPNNLSSRVAAFGLLIPMILVGNTLLIYGVYRHKHERHYPGTYMIRVSEDERDLIIRRRRATNC